MIDFSQNYFALFGLPPAYQLDSARLEQSFRDIQAQVHPDKFANSGAAEKRLSMQWATQVNQAYQTLKDPIARARYLLQLQNIDTQEETNTSMPAGFLMEQMEWREAIAEAQATNDVPELDHLHSKARKSIQQLQEELGQQLDQRQDYAHAAENVRKLRFFEKLREEIKDALEALEA